MRSCLGFLLIFGVLGGAVPARAQADDDLSGVFEIASLGADRRVEVWLADGKFTAYRVLHPEFQGERYKLEHLFIGKREGAQIKGHLWVREEGMPDFEKLRAFVGSVESGDKLMLDGLPIDRQAEELSGEPPTLKPKKRRRRGMPKTSIPCPGPARVQVEKEVV